MGCCRAILNLLLFAGSLYILANGIVQQSNLSDEYSSFYNVKYYTSPSLVIAVGSIMSLISGFGLFTFMCQSVFCTKPFKKWMLTALVLIMVGGIIGYLCEDNALNNLLYHFQTTMDSYRKNEGIKSSWDVMQFKEHCCGTYGYGDWKNISSIPDSCCEGYPGGDKNCTDENAFKMGCFTLMRSTVHSNALFLLVPAIVIGCLERGNTLRLKYSCEFPPCTSGYYVDRTGNLNIKNKHFYKETKKDALNQWKHVCRVSDGINCTSFYVCEDHFLEKDFVNHTRCRLNY